MTSKVSLRVHLNTWRDAARRAALLRFLQARRGTLDEVALFTSFTHALLPLQEISQRAAAMPAALADFRAAGLRAGINHLATIGHADEDVAHALNEPWQRLTDVSGVEARACYCARDERMRDYIRSTYRTLAQAGPDFIWIDDDLRLEWHKPVQFACFCPLCLAHFGARTGRSWTRETLAQAFDSGTSAERTALRKQWLENNRHYVSDVVALIRGAVDEVRPGLPVGLMTADTGYSGTVTPAWSEALRGEHIEAAPAPVMWRPGGGFYQDMRPDEFLEKAHSMGRQCAGVPDWVTDIQYEHEDFPHQRIAKSATIFVAEIAAAIGAGCSGVALNCTGLWDEPVDDYSDYFDAVRECRPLFTAMARAFGRSGCEGLFAASAPDAAAAYAPQGNWFSAPLWASPASVITPEWTQLGLPWAYDAKSACLTLVSGDGALQYSREQWLEVLKGGVLLDAPALGRLHEMGLGEYSGFVPQTAPHPDLIERFSRDELNGEFAGRHRDCRPWLSGGAISLLEPLSPTSRALSEAVDFAGVACGVTTGVFENALGGRVATLGYIPWSEMRMTAKAGQLKALCRWLSRDTLPAYVSSGSKAALWCRRDADGRPAMLLMNASLDGTAKLRLHVRQSPELPSALTMHRRDGQIHTLPAGKADAKYAAFEVPHLKPYEFVLFQAGT